MKRLFILFAAIGFGGEGIFHLNLESDENTAIFFRLFGYLATYQSLPTGSKSGFSNEFLNIAASLVFLPVIRPPPGR